MTQGETQVSQQAAGGVPLLAGVEDSEGVGKGLGLYRGLTGSVGVVQMDKSHHQRPPQQQTLSQAGERGAGKEGA